MDFTEVARLRQENEELRRRLNGIGTLENLKIYNARLSQENSRLKDKCAHLKKELVKLKQPNDSQTTPDDVLVDKIYHLQSELDKERKAHQKDVQELKDRLDVAVEINAKLRAHNDEVDHRSQEIADKHIDILATVLSLYPYTPDKDLVFEFGLPRDKISMVASILGAVKSPEARREAVEYLQYQHRELIQRRGGDQGNHVNAKSVEKVSRNGRVLETYHSLRDAHKDSGYCQETITAHCQQYDKKRIYTKEGFTFRYKTD